MSYLLFGGFLLVTALGGGHFWLLFALGWLGSKLVQKIKERRQRKKLYTPNHSAVQEKGPELLVISAEPDFPVPFGYKMQWAAVRCDNPEWVISALRPVSRQSANWKSGIAGVYADNHKVFLSPCLHGFVLMVGLSDDNRELGLIGSFPEVKFFGSHRVVDYYEWTKYLNGQCARNYCYADGEVKNDQGILTPEELALGFDRFPAIENEKISDADWDSMCFPNEEDVLHIAAAWGVDPKFESKTYSLGTGWLCTVN